MSGNDLVSKCMAIQYGVFIAGAILLVIILYNWFNDYSHRYLSSCSGGHVTIPFQAPPTPMVSKFAAQSVNKDPRYRPLNGKISERQLSENFLSYRADQDPQDFDDSYFNVSAQQDPSSPEFDPAKESLEQSVFDSHKEFVDEAYSSTSGPSATNVERDDNNDINVRWGARRVDYTSVFPSDESRSTHSEYPDQLASDNGSFVL